MASKRASCYIRGVQAYLDLMRHCLDHGTRKSDRTGTGTISIFGYQMRFDLKAGFPLITTKKLHFKSIVYELVFLRGIRTSNTLTSTGENLERMGRCFGRALTGLRRAVAKLTADGRAIIDIERDRAIKRHRIHGALS
jgi:hypothetical protein